jgi:two-component system, NtrC family, response regulator GlrR
MTRNAEPTPGKKPPLVLLVDDDATILKMLTHALKRHGYAVESTSSSEEALQWAASKRYDAAVIDLVMPDHDGLALAEALRGHITGLPIAIFTGYTHSPLIDDARRIGVAILKKPIATQEIVDFIAAAL